METEEEVRAELAASSGLFKGMGILLIILGAGAILLPNLAALSVVLFAGWVLVIAAVFIFVSAFTVVGAGGTIVRIIWALVALIAGLILLFNPDVGIGTLTWILGLYFLFMGSGKLAIAIRERSQPGAGWIALNGALSLLIGLIIVIDVQNSKDWAIGLLLGIEFIFAGWMLLMLGSSAKQLGQDS